MKTKTIILLIICLILLDFLFVINAGAQEERTTITGNEMKIIDGGDKIIYSGNSKVVKGENVLNAEKIVRNAKNNIVEASGNVNFLTFNSEKEKISGKSENAKYNLKSGKGQLWNGNPKIMYYLKTATSPVQLEAQKIDFDTKTEEIYAKGKVSVISSSVTSYSPETVFKQKEKIIIMTGKNPQPEVIYNQEENKSDCYADKITFFLNKKKIFFENNVSCRMHLKD